MAKVDTTKNLIPGNTRKYLRKIPVIFDKTNIVMLALIYSNNISISYYCDELLISYRAFYGWLHHRSVPKYKSHVDKLCSLLDIEEEILFCEEAYNHADIARIRVNDYFQYIHKPRKKVIRRILYGLFVIYKLSTKEFYELTGIADVTVWKWIYGISGPQKEYKKIACEFFNLPEDILFKRFDKESEETND